MRRHGRFFLGLILTGVGLSQAAPLESLQRYLFPPELIMRHQRQLKLTEEQRNYILEQIQEAQAQFTSLHWDLEREVEVLASKLKEPGADESVLLSQLDIVLDLERQVKRTQLIVGVRIRSILSQEQLNILERLKLRNVPRPPEPGRRPLGRP